MTSDAWTDQDLAVGLSRNYRWGGHSRWELPLSVAQHSLLVMAMRQGMQPHQPLAPREALRELLHEAEEALMGGFDPVSPLRPHLGAGFQALAERLRSAVALRYRLPAWEGDDLVLHKRADRLAAVSEALHVVGWPREEIRDTLGIPLTPLQADPLLLLDGLQPWEPCPRRGGPPCCSSSSCGSCKGPPTLSAQPTLRLWLLSGSGVVGRGYAIRAPSRALPRRRALCTNWKKPR